MYSAYAGRGLAMRMLVKRAATAALIITTVLFSGCYLLPKEEETLEVPLLQAKEIVYKTYEAKRGDIICYVDRSGQVRIGHVADCFFEYKGGASCGSSM